MNVNSYFPAMKVIAENGLKRQKVNPGDWYNDDEILICGKCGEPRQSIRDFPDPIPYDINRTSQAKVVRECRCEREAKAAEERRKKAEEDMERVKALRKTSLMDTKFTNARFSSFIVNEYNEKNLRLCKRYASGFKEMLSKNQGLLMWGDVGTGKSFSAACIANFLMDNKYPVIMTSFVKLLETFRKNDGAESEFYAAIRRVPLVIFDDLGTERDTSFAIEKIYNIVDTRYRSGLPMIVTTNLSLQDMMEETDIRYKRIFDRVCEACFPMQFTGQSWRMKAAFERFEAMEKFAQGGGDGNGRT